MCTRSKILKLFSKKIALIIDDQIADEESQAFKIKREFEDAGMIFATYKSIPAEIQWEGLSDISFALIDWNLREDRIEDLGIPTTYGISTLKKEEEDSLIRFITELMSKYLVPIIIFTQEDTEYVRRKLEHSIRSFLDQGQVIVHHKNELVRQSVEEVLYKWCNNNPSVYTLISISNSINCAKIDMFTELGLLDSKWPVTVYKTIEADQPEDINQEFAEFILSSLVGRIEYPSFDKFVLDKPYDPVEEEIINIYSSAKLFKYKTQPAASYSGDLYINKQNGQDGPPDKFLLNITAGCDIRGNKHLYIKGRACDSINYQDGVGIVNKSVSNYVPMLCGNKCVEFQFRTYCSKNKKSDMSTITIGEIEYQRIGRLMHPYITEIQERFSSFICRHGNIRHPDSILKDLS